MTMPTPEILEAAKQGIERAGFTEVKASARDEAVIVTGWCPCGQEMSNFGAMPYCAEWGPPELVTDRFEAMGLTHIELDHAEGRWTD